MKTQSHECFCCGSSLEGATIIWDKTNDDSLYVKMFDDEGTEVHTKSVMCSGCGLVQVYNPLTYESLDELYDYQEKYGSSMYRHLYPLQENELEIHMHTMFDIISRHKLLPKQAKMLDIGSGSDLIVKELHNSGFKDIYISDKGVNSEFNIYNKHTTETFDLVTMSNTLEHFHNPVKGLEYAASLTKQDGMILVIVPDLINTHIGIPLNAWFSAAHMYHFDWFSFSRVMKRAGLYPVIFTEVLEPAGIKICAVLSKYPGAVLSKYPGGNFEVPPFTNYEVKLKTRHIESINLAFNIRKEILTEKIAKGWKKNV